MIIEDNKLLEYKRRLERKIKRNKDTIAEYEVKKDSLSVHGHWSLGYYIGINSELENLLDNINDLLVK